MDTEPNPRKATDIPTQVFEKFLEAAAGTNLPAELLTRLRKTLVEDKAYGESALKAAIFGEE